MNLADAHDGLSTVFRLSNYVYLYPLITHINVYLVEK